MEEISTKKEATNHENDKSPNLYNSEAVTSLDFNFIKEISNKSSDAEKRKLIEVIKGLTAENQKAIALSLSPDVIAEVNMVNVSNMAEDIRAIKNYKWRTKNENK